MTELATLLGNETAEKVLLFLVEHKEAHAAWIASFHEISRSQVLKQLVRLERGGILEGRYVGRTRVFTLAAECSLYSEIMNLVGRANELRLSKEQGSAKFNPLFQRASQSRKLKSSIESRTSRFETSENESRRHRISARRD